MYRVCSMLLLIFLTIPASGQSLCSAELTATDTQGSVKAKLKCLADEREKLKAELSEKTAKMQELTQLRANDEAGYKAKIADLSSKLEANRTDSWAYYFNRFHGDKRQCRDKANRWIVTTKLGNVGLSGETYTSGKIGDQFVVVLCGMTFEGGIPTTLDVGLFYVQGGGPGDAGKLKNEFSQSNETPF